MNTYRVIIVDKRDNSEDCEDEDLESFEEAESVVDVYREGLHTGREIYRYMGDVDDSEIYEEDEVAYRIEEVDEDGDVVDSWDYDN